MDGVDTAGKTRMAGRDLEQRRPAFLRGRTLVSAILIPAVGALFYLDHESGTAAPWLLALCLLVVARGSWELVDLLRVRRLRVHYPTVALGSMAVVASGWIEPAGWTGGSAAGPLEGPPGLVVLGPVAMAFSFVLLLLFLVQAIRYRNPRESVETLSAELLVVGYVGLLLSVTVQLRWVAGAEAGYLALASLIIAAKSGDIGAYTFGRVIGGPKLAPRLSPGKTWAGAAGALVGSGLGGWAWLQWAPPLFDTVCTPAAVYWTVSYGMIIGLTGLIGDLAESLIKRDVGRKDSAGLFPGFGGLLDLLDSILYAGPVAYLLWKLMPLATWT